MDGKKKERPIKSSFERKSRQVNENGITEPQINSSSVSADANKIDSSDSVCTGRESISSTTSPEPFSSSSGIVNPSNTNLPNKPHKPRLKKFPLIEMGNQKREFNPKWFDEFKFLHYREECDSVICHTCAVADNQNFLKTDTKKERTFIDNEFFKWTKALENFRVYENSDTHKHVIEVLSYSSHIDELLSQHAASQKRENLRCLMKILENIVFLGKQGLAFRGDGDDKTGNFYQLVLLRAKDDPALLKWIDKTYDRQVTPPSTK